jgi:hypothetical protein
MKTNLNQILIVINYFTRKYKFYKNTQQIFKSNPDQ